MMYEAVQLFQFYVRYLMNIIQDEIGNGQTLQFFAREFNRERPLACIRILQINTQGNGRGIQVQFMSEGDRRNWRERVLTVNESFELTLERGFGIKANITFFEVRVTTTTPAKWHVSFRADCGEGVTYEIINT